MPKHEKTEQCPVCGKKFSPSGIRNHTASCQKLKEEAENPKIPKAFTPPLNLGDKLPQEKTEQEKADLNQLEQAEALIQQRQQAGEGFTPQEVDTLNQIIQPLEQRQGLRNEVAMESLETQRQQQIASQEQIREKREGSDDAPSWKDVISLKKVEMMGESKSGGHSEFIALMNSQNQSSQQMFQMMMANQDKAHQSSMAGQQQMFNFMIEQLKESKEDKSVLSQISDVKNAAKALGLKKEAGGDSEIGETLSKLAVVAQPLLNKIIKDKEEAKGLSGPQQIFPLEPNPIPTDPNSIPAEPIETKSISGEGGQSVPMPSPQPQVLTDQKVDEYAHQHGLALEKAGDHTDQMLGLGRFKRKGVVSPMVAT